MDKNSIISAIEDIKQLDVIPLDELNSLIEMYPYFLSGRMLLLKKLHQKSSLQFDQELKITSAQAIDRKKIYELIYQQNVIESIEEIESELKDNVSTTTSDESKPDEHENEVSLTSIPITQLSTINKFENKTIEESQFQNEKKEDKDTEEVYGQLEKEILQHAVSYSIEKEVQDDIDEQKGESTFTIENTIPEKQTFVDWLKILDKKKLSEIQNPKKQETSTDEIISNFIKNEPQITKPNKDDKDVFTPTNLPKLNIVDQKDFVTETLAKIYAKQGNVKKAIQAYQNLMLKFPEKKTYFADQIKKLQNEKA